MDLEPEVLIALILGGSGAVVGLLALFVGLFARMAAGRTQRDLEAFRQQAMTEQSADWMKTKQLETKLRATRAAWKAIETVRQTIDNMMEPGDEGGPLSSYVATASNVGRNLTKKYDDLAKNLDESDQAALKRAREAAVELAFTAEKAAEHAGSSGIIPPADRAALLEIRRRLSDCIETLRTRQLGLVTRHILDRGEAAQ